MDLDKYFNMDVNRLYHDLITDVAFDFHKGEGIIKGLMNSEKYREDYAFRATVDLVKILTDSSLGRREGTIQACMELINRATAFQMWPIVSTSWNILGNEYFYLEIVERSFECYSMAINTEKKQGINIIMPLAYNNIGLIYTNLQDHEKASMFLQKAVDELERAGADKPRYIQKKIPNLSNLIIEYFAADKVEEATEVYKELQKIDFSELGVGEHYYKDLSEMVYHLKIGNPNEGKKAYHRARSVVIDNPAVHAILMCGFINNSLERKPDYSFCIEEIKEVERLVSMTKAVFTVDAYSVLRKYYMEIGDMEKFDSTTPQYLKLLEQNMTNVREKHTNALEVVDTLLKENKKVDLLETQNDELQRLVSEVTKNKNELMEAYNRLEVVGKLGRQLTSSLDLNEIVTTVYRDLMENVPLHTFTVAVAEPERNRLKSVANYDFGKPGRLIEKRLDDKESIFVACYHENRTILSSDEVYQRLVLKQKHPDEIPSVIFLPLTVGNKTIGVCSIQYEKSDAYTEEHLQYLEGLCPYLSIALNNALKSWELEEEVCHRKKIQSELEKANKQLERISSLDGLTEINGRRTFETKIIELLEEARKNDDNIMALMIDIDNFKFYNDTYGHLEGDEVLKKVAQTFRKNMDRVRGLSARFGGEEFIGAAVGLTERESLEVAESIRRDVFEMQIPHCKATAGVVTVSIGVAISYDPGAEDKSELMRVADESLYEAKNTGKNKVVVSRV